MSERETCAICGYHGCPGHLYYGNDCSVTFKTDNTAVIRTLEKRIAELERVAEEAAELFQNYGDEMSMEFTDLEQYLLEAGYLGVGNE